MLPKLRNIEISEHIKCLTIDYFAHSTKLLLHYVASKIKLACFQEVHEKTNVLRDPESISVIIHICNL